MSKHETSGARARVLEKPISSRRVTASAIVPPPIRSVSIAAGRTAVVPFPESTRILP
jgi:hypothetical protein